MPELPIPFPRFAVDAMLGRLARWLRVLGFDTFFDPAVHDHELVRLADAEDRILLTRDRHLLRELRPRQSLEIRRDEPLAQLQAVMATLALPRPPGLFTRCMVCNGELSEPLCAAQVAQLAPQLPPGLQAPPRPVRRCPDCGRIYWNGSHVRRMRRTLAQALPGWVAPEEPA